MKTYKILFIGLLTTACPQDDGPMLSGETGVNPTVTGSPDLPPENTASSTGDPGDGDGDGDGDTGPTTDGDGDGDGDSSGDGDGDPGDGDGDTGSEAVPASLIVESNGQRIGYMTGVWDYGVLVWDDVNEVTVQLNQQTGHVVGSPGQSGYFTTANCTGTRYEQAVYVPIELCAQTGAPSRRFVRGDNVLSGGHIVAPNLVATSSEPQIVNVQSVQSGMNCAVFAAQYCMFAMQSTNVIPKTFALPITVAETLAMP
jgi:hypothetical protein